MRKPVQVSMDSGRVLALCDDGSLWYIKPGTNARWMRFPDVPAEGDGEPGPKLVAKARTGRRVRSRGVE
jgi:hypothetical protein